MNLANLRKDYGKGVLSENSLEQDPIKLFATWFQDAVNAGEEEPNIMTFATISTKGFPSARIVLLKDFDERGFVFYTNYMSRKGNHIKNNPNAALVFFWPKLERQVRIEGMVEKVSKKESDEYFATRPRQSQISAAVSEQSSTIPDRNYLEMLAQLCEKKYEGKEIPKPENWGGYRVLPLRIEFWQGRENRLHDRFKFCVDKEKKSGWKIKRLAP